MLMTAALLQACGGSSGSGEPSQTPEEPTVTRSIDLGFTPWPYDATTAAVSYVYSEAALRGDFIAHHLDGGIPWQEALDGTPYSAELEAEISARITGTPTGMRSYLAISPLNGGRNGLADYWGTGTNQPLPAPWDSRALDDPNVINAYINFASDLIQRFDPDTFNLGIEASELAVNDLAAFDDLVDFTAAVSAELRTRFPNLQLMISVALKDPGSVNAALLRTELPRLIQHIDIVGVSVYPYVFFDHPDRGDPANLPTNWLSQVVDLADGKPIAIAETGWPAEDLTIPTFSVDFPSTPAFQDAYVSTLFTAAEALDAEFIVWFFLVDYDDLWNGALAQDPVARIWRDTGLFDENLNPRPALDTWMNYFRTPKD